MMRCRRERKLPHGRVCFITGTVTWEALLSLHPRLLLVPARCAPQFPSLGSRDPSPGWAQVTPYESSGQSALKHHRRWFADMLPTVICECTGAGSGGVVYGD